MLGPGRKLAASRCHPHQDCLFLGVGAGHLDSEIHSVQAENPKWGVRVLFGRGVPAQNDDMVRATATISLSLTACQSPW